MEKIEIHEQELENSGKLAIFQTTELNDPETALNEAVEKYVGNKPFNQFKGDNPYLRVVIGGINNLIFTPFENQRL